MDNSHFRVQPARFEICSKRLVSKCVFLLYMKKIIYYHHPQRTRSLSSRHGRANLTRQGTQSASSSTCSSTTTFDADAVFCLTTNTESTTSETALFGRTDKMELDSSENLSVAGSGTSRNSESADGDGFFRNRKMSATSTLGSNKHNLPLWT